MLKSISNNFGGPEITFRAAQHDRYVVLNAHFTYDPAGTAYLAAQELEIKLPDLNCTDLEMAKSMVKGTARSMGVTVEE